MIKHIATVDVDRKSDLYTKCKMSVIGIVERVDGEDNFLDIFKSDDISQFLQGIDGVDWTVRSCGPLLIKVHHGDQAGPGAAKELLAMSDKQKYKIKELIDNFRPKKSPDEPPLSFYKLLYFRRCYMIMCQNNDTLDDIFMYCKLLN